MDSFTVNVFTNGQHGAACRDDGKYILKLKKKVFGTLCQKYQNCYYKRTSTLYLFPLSDPSAT